MAMASKRQRGRADEIAAAISRASNAAKRITARGCEVTISDRVAADLDRYVTGNWGEDSVPPEPGENDPCGECGHIYLDHCAHHSIFDVTDECWHGSGSGNRCPCREFVQREED